MRRLVMNIPSMLVVFFAAVFINNTINLLIRVYGSDDVPARATSLQASAAISLLAAGAWTALAAKLEHIERAMEKHPDSVSHRDEREHAYDVVLPRLSVYLVVALVLSAGAIYSLVHR